MSTRNPTYGTKVTDTSAPEIEEGVGTVDPSSLAAESIESGGTFSTNPDSSSKAPFTATKYHMREMPPTDSASSRQDTEINYPHDLGGQAKELAVTDTTGSYTTGGKTSYAETAPSYVDSQFVDTVGPKGDSLKEGGFRKDGRKNASFEAGIGSENDPGREAEKDFEGAKANEGEAGDLGEQGSGQFGALGDEES